MDFLYSPRRLMVYRREAVQWRKLITWIGFILFVIIGGFGCSSARMSDYESNRLFRSGQYDQAADRLKFGLKSHGETGRDALLYWVDIGLALHSAGKYEESNEAFLKADRIAEIKDYTSLSAETATLFTSDNLKDYKGEDFEKVLINTYLAMNFALLGDFENSLVEARRVNHKLHLMVTEGQRKYKQSAFARYLSAILYEAENNYNDAYVDYKNARALLPHFPGIGTDLWRCAWILRMRDEMEKWDEEYHLTEKDHAHAKMIGPKSQKAEIVVLYENGISPVKRPNPQFSDLPKFYPRYNPVTSATIEINGENKGNTEVLDDIEETAIRNLDEKYGGLVAKKLAGAAAKVGLGYGIAKMTKNDDLGFLAAVAMFVSDQADLRSWNLLPRDLQILRVSVDPGTYTVRALPSGMSVLPEKTVQVAAGKKVFVNFRYMP